jgi:hypothetical protein
MSITTDVRELESLNLEIKRISGRARDLRKKAKIVEGRIIHYLKSKGDVGAKFGKKAIVLENKSRRTIKRKSDREIQALHILESQGVSDPEKVLQAILESRKGDTEEVQKLMFRRIKTKK